MIHNNKNRYSKGNINNRIKKSIEAIINEIRNTIREEINSRQEKKEITEKKKGGNGVKWTDVAMVVISGFLAYYTFQLFNKTIISTDAAVRADSIAVEALRLSQRQFDSTTQSNKETNEQANRTLTLQGKSVDAQINSFKSDSVNSARNFEISTNALKAQSDALKQQQKDFEIENRPFVQVSEIKIDTSTSGYNALLSFKIFNYGKFPANVIYVKYRLGVALSINENKISYFKTETSNHNIYVASGVNYLPEFGGMKSTSTYIQKAVKDGEVTMYLYVEIRYNSYGSKKAFLHTSLNKIKYGVSNFAISNIDVEVK